jgi:trimethylamine--corrinoid protein Co-methyltransferase
MGMSYPFFNLLRAEDITAIDAKARQVLTEVGISITSEKYRCILEQLGARVFHDTKMVRFDGSWLDRQLDKAPTSFTLYSRDNRNNILMEGKRVHFGNGGRAFRILDLMHGGYRETLLRDIANSAALVQNLDRIQVYIIACQAHDILPEFYHVHDFYHAFNNTTKHVMGGCDTMEGAKQMYELACIIARSAVTIARAPTRSLAAISTESKAPSDSCSAHRPNPLSRSVAVVVIKGPRSVAKDRASAAASARPRRRARTCANSPMTSTVVEAVISPDATASRRRRAGAVRG